MRSWLTTLFSLLVALFLFVAPAYAGLRPPPPEIPEISPGAMFSAMALLGASMLLLTDRIRRK